MTPISGVKNEMKNVSGACITHVFFCPGCERDPNPQRPIAGPVGVMVLSLKATKFAD